MRKIGFAIVALSVAFALGCSDDTKNAPTDGGKKDGKKFDKGVDGQIVIPEGGTPDKKKDGTVVTTCDPKVVGKPCKADTDCGGSHFCLGLSSTKEIGICSCECTPDDSGTPLVNEDSCPELNNHVCATIGLSDGTDLDMCLQTCSPKLGSNECGTGIACDPGTIYYTDFKRAACFGLSCTADADCPVATATACSVAQKNCPTGETCLTEIGTDKGVCTKPGKCDTASGLCADHTLGKATAKVGDACKSDLDCAGNMRCVGEFNPATYSITKKGGAACTKDEECCSFYCQSGKCYESMCTVRNRNGYCMIMGCKFPTLTTKACPTGSVCSLNGLGLSYGGVCLKGCDMTKAAECRGNTADLLGDYECRNWSAIGFGGDVIIASGPTCEPGDWFGCNDLQTSKLDCSSVGADVTATTPTNPTNMKCRGYNNTVLTNAYDPAGLCLDDTASGTTQRNPLPTP
jgi:hypothetical protein